MVGQPTMRPLNSLGGGKSKMSFTFLFYKHIMFRKSCAKCHFANTRRPSDITIADFWGWEKTNPKANVDDKGLSLILCNTEKGRKLFDAIKGDLNYFPAKLDDVLQPNMIHPSVPDPKRDQFEKDYARKGFKYVYYKYGEDGWRYKSKKLLQRVKSKIKRIIKKVL